MGGIGSRNRQANVPGLGQNQYPPGYGQGPINPYQTGSPPRSPPLFGGKQNRELMEANRRIQELQNQLMMMQSRNPTMAGQPSGSYTSAPMINTSSGYRPPSPLLQRLSGQDPFSNQAVGPVSSGGTGAYRDTDYFAVANIAGLNPGDVALLHREYMNLTRGGTNKIDRVVFRQLLRESLVEANNENIDRTIENIFISIDRNRDGFIDFPEFVGAFRDLLRGGSSDSFSSPNFLNDPMQNISVPSTGFGLPASSPPPIVYNGNSPLVISLDPNSSPYAINPQGQSVVSSPTVLQCVPLPMI